jgi:hypothetical protein
LAYPLPRKSSNTNDVALSGTFASFLDNGVGDVFTGLPELRLSLVGTPLGVGDTSLCSPVCLRRRHEIHGSKLCQTASIGHQAPYIWPN